MSSLNREQQDHMRALSVTPPERVSWCGWGYVGDKWCCGDPGCPGKSDASLSLAIRQALQDKANA